MKKYYELMKNKINQEKQKFVIHNLKIKRMLSKSDTRENKK